MADKRVALRWTGEGLRFRGGADGGPEVVIDGDAEAGASPMEGLLLSLVGCMGIDVVVILEKMKVPLEGISVEVEGDRAEEPPRRYTGIRAVFRLEGVPEEGWKKAERAVRLSTNRYCSVLHSLREDLSFTAEIEPA